MRGIKYVMVSLILVLLSSCLSSEERHFIEIPKEKPLDVLTEKSIESLVIGNYVFFGKKNEELMFFQEKFSDNFIQMIGFRSKNECSQLLEYYELLKVSKELYINRVTIKQSKGLLCFTIHNKSKLLSTQRDSCFVYNPR